MGKSLVKAPLNIFTNGLKRIPTKFRLLILGIILLSVFGAALNFRIHAKATGGMIGESTGTLTGRAIGSLDGLTRGQIEGYEAGKEEGLSAKDTTAELATKIQEVERLEVLVASGTFSDLLTVGEDSVNYAALLIQKYNAVFTVNLGTADIELLEDGLHILLDQPIVDFYPTGEAEKKNEFEGTSALAKGNTLENGYKAADNAMNELPAKAEEKLQSDESLMTAARNAAVNQLTQLVNAVSLSKPEVIVEFRGGDEND